VRRTASCGSARVERLRVDVGLWAGVSADQVRVVRSPYRMCPLGAHVDHQLGQVTGLALDRALLLGFVPRSDGRVALASRQFDRSVEFSLADLPHKPAGDWGDYARGAAFALCRSQTLNTGIYGMVDGHDNVGGLSSSAAVGVAYLLALQHVNGLRWSAEGTIELDRIVENDYLGLQNGILDQSVILLGQGGRLPQPTQPADTFWRHPGARRRLPVQRAARAANGHGLQPTRGRVQPGGARPPGAGRNACA